MIRYLYILKSDGDPIYGRSFEDNSIVDLRAIPSFVKNTVILFHSQSSTSSERVYTLMHNDSIWSYVFFSNFALISLSDNDADLVDLKSIMLSIGRNLAMKFGDLISTWSGSMSEIFDVDMLIEQFLAMNLDPLTKKIRKKIDKLITKALQKPEIAYVGVFDSKGKMIEGNLPETHLFRIEVEISQGSIKPVMDIVPTSVNSGDHKLQMLQVNTLTVVAATQETESALRAVAVVGEIAHALDDLM